MNLILRQLWVINNKKPSLLISK